ncbi:Peptidase (plasmid) [Euzebya pacifica]|uniref:Peptidase n=1 Tax=Euzebya pacifica TaxID=1608957 RepID=A0A346Y782_9ACTN|nr:Peptidase [Euzebya pacifica]
MVFSQTGVDPSPSPTPATGEPLPAPVADSGAGGFFDDDGAAVIGPTEFVSGGHGPFLLSEDYLDGAFNWSESSFAGNPQMGDAALDAILTEMNAYLRLWLDGEVSGPTEYLNGYLGTSTSGPVTSEDDAGIDADALAPELEEDIVSPEGWVIAPGSTNASGQGTPVAYTVEVEDGLGPTAASVAGTVDAVLLDHRSWAAAGRPLQRTASLTLAHVRVVLVSDATKTSLCGPDPLCVSGNVIAVGLSAWTAPPGHFSGGSDWRAYLLNHAIGVHLGQPAGTCGTGKPAPVTMRQFTATDLGDCVAGPWVDADAALGGGGFAPIDLDPDAITQLVRVGNMDRRFLASDQDWETHLAYWRMALEAIEPMVDLTDVQICTLPVHGLTTPQKIDRAVRCEALNLPIHVIDPVTGNVMDRNDAVNLLGQEAVQVAWLYNEWGQKVPCDSDRSIGGIFPVPPSPLHDDDNNPDTPPVPYYDRCDEATNLKIAMVGHHSLPPGVGLIDQHAAPVRGSHPARPYEWMLRGWGWNAGVGGLNDDGIFDKAAGNDNFPADGPAVIGQWAGGGLVCDQALLQFVGGLMGEDFALPDTWRLPSSGGLLLEGADALATLWADLQGMEQWDPVDQACAPPYPDGEPHLDRLFAYAVFDAFRSVSPDLSVFEDPTGPADEPSGDAAPEAVRRLYAHAQAQAFRSEDGQSVLTSAQWGVTSSVSRLANPAIIVEVPTWTPAAHPDFANYVMAYALSMVGEDCGGIGFGSAGTTLTGTTDLSTGAGQLSWEEIAQIAYDAGFRGEDLIVAVALTQPESGRNPSINNAGTNTNGTIDYGLWQINDIHNPPIPGIYEPVVNARFAYDIYRTAPRGGGYNFTPWSAFNAGRHTQWLDEARAGAEAALGDRINDPPPEGSKPPLPGGQPAGTQAFAGACMTVGGLSLVGANGLVCPNAGPTTFWNDWGASRGGGSRTHKGLDMFAAVGVPIVANESGTIGYSGLSSSRNPGNRVQLRGDSGNHWLSLHMDSIDPTIAPGVRVQQGQVLGTVGYTGNAYGTPAHNHHQFHPNGGASSPLYEVMSVVCAQNMGTTTGSAPGGMDQAIFASATSTKCMPARTCSGQPG